MQATTSTERIFLTLEQPGFPMDIVGIFVIAPSADGTPVDAGDIRVRLDQVAHRLPVLRKKLVPAPLGIGQDHWITAPSIDVDDHVRRVEVDEPGDLPTLLELVVDLTKAPLDRSRPLWDAHVVEGMAQGRTALVLRSHHALVDGMGSMEIHAALFDLAPTPVDRSAPMPEPAGEPDPSLLARALREVPDRLLVEVDAVRRLASTAAVTALDAALRPVQALANAGRAEGDPGPDADQRPLLALPRLPRMPGYLPSLTGNPPRTIFNRRVHDPEKALAAISLPFSEIQEIRTATGATVNDILLALVTGSLRRYLSARDELPDKPLRTTCPVNVRRGDESKDAGNAFTTMWVDLPTNVADPAERLRLVHESSTAAKAALASSQASWDVLATVGDMLFPGVVAGAMAIGRTAAVNRLPPSLNLTVSTLKGAPVPLHLAGHLVEHLYTRTIIYSPVTIFFSSITYNGSVELSITTVKEIVPDVEVLVEALRTELDDLLALVCPPRAPRTPKTPQKKARPAR